MGETIRISNRWTARVGEGKWTVIDGPADLLVGLNATLPNGGLPTADTDLTCARAALRLYPDSEVCHLPPRGGPRS